MKRILLFLLLCSVSVFGQYSASVTLNASSPGTATVNIGNQIKGNISDYVDITVTNGTGGPLTIYSNYYVQMSGWPAGKQNFVQYDGDGIARSYAKDITNSCIQSVDTNAYAAVIAQNGTCHVYGYNVPTMASSVGHIVFTSPTGQNLATVTINATGVDQSNSTIQTPVDFDTSYPNTTGYTITNVSSGGSFQAAIDAAACGTVLKFPSGSTYTGNFTYRNKACDDTHWIILLNDLCSATDGTCTTLPNAGTRVTKAQAASMVTLRTPNDNPVLLMENTSNHYRMVGFRVTQQNPAPVNNYQQSLVSMEPSVGSPVTAPSQMPHHIFFDRTYIHTYPNDNPEFVGNILGVCGKQIAVMDSILWSDGGANELQAVSWTCNLSGPGKFLNTEMVHSGENFFLGGADGWIMGTPMTDVYLYHNYIHKPMTWNQWCWAGWTGSNPCGATTWDFGFSPVAAVVNRGTYAAGTTYAAGDLVYTPDYTCHHYVSLVNGNIGQPLTNNRTKWWCTERQVKNLLELKKGHKVKIDYNVLDGVWAQAQDGSGLLLECANQSGSDIFACIRDLTFRHNVIRNVAYCINAVTSSYAYPTEASIRFDVSDNYCYGVDSTKFGATQPGFFNNLGPAKTGTARTHNMIAGWFENYSHNTFYTDGFLYQIYQSNDLATGATYINGSFKDNIFWPRGTYGILLAGSHGATNYPTIFPGVAVQKNLIGPTDANEWLYDANYFVRPFPADLTAMKFVDVANKDFRVQATSPAHLTASDGKDYGADGLVIPLVSEIITGNNGTELPPDPPSGFRVYKGGNRRVKH